MGDLPVPFGLGRGRRTPRCHKPYGFDRGQLPITVSGPSTFVPHREYLVTGARTEGIIADSAGQALLDVDLGGRLEVTVAPR